MDMIEEVVDDTAAVNFKFKFNQQAGRWIATLKDVSKIIREILKYLAYFYRNRTGDKIALAGANGKGKSRSCGS